MTGLEVTLHPMSKKMSSVVSSNRLCLAFVCCGILAASTGCNSPQWSYQGGSYPQRVRSAKFLLTSSPDYLHIGTLRGRSTAKGRRPAPIKEQAARQAALRGGDALVHLGGGVKRPEKKVGPDQPDPRLLIREHSWAVYRLRKRQ